MTITVVDFINFAAIFPMIVLKEIFIDFINNVPPIDSLRNAPKNDPANNCLDTAIITNPKLMTKKTKKKLKNIAGRVLLKK